MADGPDRPSRRPSRRPDDPLRPTPGGLTLERAGEEAGPREAVWQGKRVAYSHRWVEVDGHVYFPEEDVEEGFLRETGTTFEHDRLGTVRWYDLKVDGDVLEEAAWAVVDPARGAEDLVGCIGFGEHLVR